MDRQSLLALNAPKSILVRRRPAITKRQRNESLIERILSIISPPRINRRIDNFSDTLDYYYRINRRGEEGNPELTPVKISALDVAHTRTPQEIYDDHLHGCRQCSENQYTDNLCVIGKELDMRVILHEKRRRWRRQVL